jgi:hypothetical protein
MRLVASPGEDFRAFNSPEGNSSGFGGGINCPLSRRHRGERGNVWVQYFRHRPSVCRETLKVAASLPTFLGDDDEHNKVKNIR